MMAREELEIHVKLPLHLTLVVKLVLELKQILVKPNANGNSNALDVR